MRDAALIALQLPSLITAAATCGATNNSSPGRAGVVFFSGSDAYVTNNQTGDPCVTCSHIGWSATEVPRMIFSWFSDHSLKLPTKARLVDDGESEALRRQA